MAHITAETSLVSEWLGAAYLTVPVYAAAQIYKGGIVVVVGGYAKPGYGNSGAAGFVIGTALEAVIGGTNSGDVTIKVEPLPDLTVFDASSADATWIGTHVFMYDDTSVIQASSTTYTVPIGTVVGVLGATTAYGGGSNGVFTRVIVDTRIRGVTATY